MKRARTQAQRILGKLGLGSHTELDPAMEDALERRHEERQNQLVHRERVAEALLTLGSLLGAIALALFAPTGRAFDPALAVALAAAAAIAYCVRFHDGAGYTAPTELVLVPMLLLLPAATVPLVMIAAVTMVELRRFARGHLHVQRLLISPANAAYALPPAAVIALAAPADPTWHAWPVYAGALAAQFGLDFVISAVRDWFVIGLGADLGLAIVAWTWLVDGILATVGLTAAIAARDDPFTSLLVLPVMALLALFSRERDARIEHSRELGRAYRGTTLLLSDVLDGDDEYTAFHSRGVVQLSIAVADRMQLDARQRRNVEFGALLHDVGKIAIPKEILNKPGKLSEDEWVVMETHTIEGQRMLDRVGGVLGDVGQIVRSSHERWDGGGYPDGLAGDEIPLESTIVSACDAFNAMTTHRPYRRALTLAQALEEMRANAGTQFSPRVVETLIELIVEEEAIVGPAAPEPKRTVELDMPTLAVPDAAAQLPR